MHCIVGLGNPGKKFENTRHNAGFIIAKRLAADSEFTYDSMLNSAFTRTNDAHIILPSTFMNASGEAVSQCLKKWHLEPNELLVIHDDLDIPFGTFKFSFDASAAGHNGVQSIIDHIHTQKFWRLRYGIAGTTKGSVPGEAYVLKKFLKDEQKTITADNTVLEAIRLFLTEGPEKAMSLFHAKSRP